MLTQSWILQPAAFHWPGFRRVTPSPIQGGCQMQPRKEGHFPGSYFVLPLDLCTILLSPADLGSNVTSSGSDTKGGLEFGPSGGLPPAVVTVQALLPDLCAQQQMGICL